MVSLPYPFGPKLEWLESGEVRTRVLWLLPITSAERAFLTSDGVNALEQKFDDAAIEYWDIDRPSVV